MKYTYRLRMIVCVSMVWMPALLLAQWPPADGFPLADREEQSNLVKVHPTSDGGCYVSWFDNADSGYDVYLQRLDAAGNELWIHNGVKIANRNMDWTADYGLDVDADGNAVLAFRDDRFGGVRATVTLVNPAGQRLWGDGVPVSDGLIEAMRPYVAATTDGGYTVAWSEYGETTNVVRVQHLNSLGQPQWASPLLWEDPQFGQFNMSCVTASDDGNAIISWVRKGMNFWDPPHLWTQKVSPSGTLLWNPHHVVVYDGEGGLEPGEFPCHHPDNQGGAIFHWHGALIGNWFDAAYQHILADGTEKFPHNGIPPTTNTDRQRFDTALTCDLATGDTYLYWIELEVIEFIDYFSVYGQKFDAEGNRLWGDGGISLVPWDTITLLNPVAEFCDTGGALASWIGYDLWGQHQIYAARQDTTGALIWDGQIQQVTETESYKHNLISATLTSGMHVVAWTDDRDGDDDIYIQNIFNDGSMGHCLADLNFDAMVTLSDLAQLLSNYGMTDGAAFEDGDIDKDGDVDLSDLAALLAVYGMDCD